ncbi:MAG TPA: recombinase family protein [Isosphaeraceae bacterium]|nr:recombinase family protein [Isosphaeraceae bacterium]
MANGTTKRCAIYTRKSSEEGLEQDYNSLHAQREAGEAFIKSQAGEGWRLVKGAYDDGGFSGATIERPGLQQLLAHIRQGMVDVVVVYKVDRLTRSLADFAKMVELFDARGVSFVAVTQQFNTTTSMGRLTLNVLLSFAQFEREVIGERIRDKVAASKRKGMWMGGVVPMGYELRERKLVVKQAEAKVVRHIFERYLELGNVRALKNELEARRFVSVIRTSKKGKRHGGKPFSRGAIYHLLSNPIYIGEIRHKHDRHPGQQAAAISRELWDRVQERLQNQSARTGESGKTAALPSPLAGKLYDASGELLYVQGAAKGQRRYRYYVSKRLVKGESQDPDRGWRISAPEIERIVTGAVSMMLRERRAIALALEESRLETVPLESALKSAEHWNGWLQASERADSALAKLVERVELGREGIRISLKLPLHQIEDDETSSKQLSLTRDFPMRLKRHGVETRIVLEGDSAPGPVDLPLLKAIARAHRWTTDLLSGRVKSIRELAKGEGMNRRSVQRLLRLGVLSPRLVQAIAEGRQPPDLTVIKLTRRIELPALWNAQEQILGLR